MTNQSDRVVERFAVWTRSPRGGALIATLLAVIILLPLWALALSWYQAATLSVELGQRSAFVFATGGLIVLVLLASLIYLLVNRQALLAQAVQQRTQDITRINHQLEEDIARRRQAEQSLHRWAHIFEHAEWGVAIGSADGRSLEMMNPAYARMHGYTVEELSGLPIASVFAPGTAAELNALIQAANETGHAVSESKHIHKNGTIFPVLVDLTAVKDENGQVLYRVANVQDISERKQVEGSLREREEQYRSIFEASLDGLFINSLDGRIVDVNPAGARMHGYTVEECRGLRSAQLVHPEQMEGLLEFIEAARAGRPFRNEGIDVRKDGSQFPIEVMGTQFLYRGEPHALALVRDITERVQVEQTLRERELQYRNVFESSLDGLFINDLTGRLVDFNPAAAHMHGYTVEEFRQVQPE